MKKTIQTHDLFQLTSVGAPVLSPSGKEAVAIQTKMDKEKNKYFSYLIHIDLETNDVVPWTFGEERISSVKWSNDGRSIAFLSTRNEKNQLFVLSVGGGEAKQLTEFDKGVDSFLWAPSNEEIWFSARVEDGKEFTDKKEEKKEDLLEAYVVDGMKYKLNGVGLLPKKTHSQIGQINIHSKTINRLFTDTYDYSLQDISHDGSSLIVSVNRVENTDNDWRSPVILIDLKTKEEEIIVEEEGYYGSATFSFDDRYIAYQGSDFAYKNAAQGNLFIYDRESKHSWNLTQALDVPVGDLSVGDVQQNTELKTVVWTEHNDLYFVLSTFGDVRLYYATLEGAIYPASPEDEHIYGFDVSRDGKTAILAVSNPVFPGELFKYDIALGKREQITHYNDAWLEETTLVQPEKISYEGDEGWTVNGWIMKPATFKEGEKYPLIVEVHGGPHTMYANTFFHELQLLAAQGYGVLYVNPRGSHSYGQQFVDGCRNHYGEGDYEDIMAGIDHVLADYNWIDTSRLGVTGGSYGGFMTNWIVGHTNRFKAAVTQRSISNWVSFFGVSDIGYYFTEWQIGADMTDVEKLWHHSPLKYSQNIETPLLILHGEEDDRCPIEQAEQLYITLKSMGKTTQFVRFPKAEHNLSRTGLPNLRIQRLEQILDWFKKYL
ncbi:S9 family peptidase [Rummeliibacillus sp. TYF-LIM-RU47]|uniref:S9 family peptidase n=1 Tax=Rummeliibacillus sp. TYF-LIM-RU47 TaxID=2608406 RepID=UPI00123882FA|nr:S9 family peptidase [Rummeliibacillus sp. TYF-LIM-RU47]